MAAFVSAPAQTPSSTPTSITSISASITSTPSLNGTITTSPTSTFTDDLGSWACGSSTSRGNLFENFSGCTYLHSTASATTSSITSSITSANGTITNGTATGNSSASGTGIPMPTETEGAAMRGTQMSATLALAMVVVGLFFGR